MSSAGRAIFESADRVIFGARIGRAADDRAGRGVRSAVYMGSQASAATGSIR